MSQVTSFRKFGLLSGMRDLMAEMDQVGCSRRNCRGRLKGLFKVHVGGMRGFPQRVKDEHLGLMGRLHCLWRHG